VRRAIVALALLFATWRALPEDAALPLIVNDVTPRAPTMVVILSGDGGWAAIDKSLAARFNAAHLPVAGLNSLQYFWHSRTPAEASADLERIITTFSKRWNSARVVVIGYSRGADVLPFMINRLSRPAADRIALIALLGVSLRVDFEFHLTDWIRDAGKGFEVRPEMERLTHPTLCFFGTKEKESACVGLHSRAITPVAMEGDHHFDGRYDLIATRILQELK
jgi:type IV secretory pathway VirJ component